MGVQKSRKSLKFTKFSLHLENNLKTHKKNLSRKTIKNIFDKHFFKKTNIFSLRKLETKKTLFF